MSQATERLSGGSVHSPSTLMRLPSGQAETHSSCRKTKNYDGHPFGWHSFIPVGRTWKYDGQLVSTQTESRRT